MPTAYIIAGPPGVGKSWGGHHFVSPQIDILNHDHIALRYRNAGATDFQKIASQQANRFLTEKLYQGLDFGLELNLGYPNHYDVIRDLRERDPFRSITLILFYTDDVQLCLDRTLARQQAGGHSVEPSVVREMYANTFPLLSVNQHLIDRLQPIDVNTTSTEMIYSRRFSSDKPEFIHSELPAWFKQY